MPPPNRESVLSPVVLKNVVKTPTLFHSSNVYLCTEKQMEEREGGDHYLVGLVVDFSQGAGGSSFLSRRTSMLCIRLR